MLHNLCVHIETGSLWAEFVNKNRSISVCLVSRRIKALNFENFHNSHNCFLRQEYFTDFLCERCIPTGWHGIHLVITLPPRASTLQYKRCLHLWNNFPCIITLQGHMFLIAKISINCTLYKDIYFFRSFLVLFINNSFSHFLWYGRGGNFCLKGFTSSWSTSLSPYKELRKLMKQRMMISTSWYLHYGPDKSSTISFRVKIWR